MKFVVNVTDVVPQSPATIVDALAEGLRFERYHDEPDRIEARLTTWHYVRAVIRLRWRSRRRFRLSGAGAVVRERESGAERPLVRR